MHPASFIKIVGGAGAIALATGCTCNGCPPEHWEDSAEFFDSDTDTDLPEDTDVAEGDSTCAQRQSETATP